MPRSRSLGTVTAVNRPRPVRWLRLHPLAADALLATFLLVVGIIGLFVEESTTTTHPRATDALAVVLVVVITVPIVLRRRHPFPVVVVSGIATVILVARNYTGTPATIASLVAVYSLAAHDPRRQRVYRQSAGILVVFTVFLLVGVMRHAPGASYWNTIGNLVTVVTALVIGDNLHRRRQRVADLEDRARTLEHTRELETERAVLDERARIARELHDVVAHSISVMVVQAGAARRILERDPDRAGEALAHIEGTGRSALTEMRRLLGVLRQNDDGPSLDPQPTLDGVEGLLDLDPSQPATLSVRGDRRTLPAAVDLCAYRIVQEALTNVRKHAGLTEVAVTIDYRPEEVEVLVADRGRGAAAHLGDTDGETGGGHGLMGMQERAALVGGSLEAGPRPGGGWLVRAVLPLELPRVAPS
jgi:signal transduction histidine kinase